jgi:hypothetical protein
LSDSGSVRNGVPNADYSACKRFSPVDGKSCQPVCLAGFRTNGTSVNSTLICDNGGDCDVVADTGDLKCSINTCSGQVYNGRFQADYSVCAAQTTGSMCTPTCLPGHGTSGVSSGFLLICDDNGDYNAAVETGNLACKRNGCTGSVSDPVANADYSVCSSKETGAICTPKCPAGYVTTGVSDGFLLVCDSGGGYNAAADNGTLRCLLNMCSGQVRNRVTNADYRLCSTKTTGQTCTPACPVGYLTTGVSSGFPLVCEENGNYNAAADAGSLRCLINTCNGPVKNGAIDVADYSSCSSKTTGVTCTPECLPGYATTVASNGFLLVCETDGAYDAAADTDTLRCSGNTCSGTPIHRVANANYSSCSFKKTGATCTPECPSGYASTPFALVCNGNGSYDAGASECKVEVLPPTNRGCSKRGFRGRGASCA